MVLAARHLQLAALLALSLILSLTVSSCGAASVGQPASGTAAPTASTSTSPTPTIAPSPGTPLPSPALGQTYTNQEFGFSIGYPSNFTWEVQVPPPGMRILFLGRANQTGLSPVGGGYPRGQIELSVNPFDADSLRAWIASRTGSGPSDLWMATSNINETATGSRVSVAFDYTVPGGPAVGIHAVVFVMKQKYLVLVNWYALDSSYATTFRDVDKAMVASFRDT